MRRSAAGGEDAGKPLLTCGVRRSARATFLSCPHACRSWLHSQATSEAVAAAEFLKARF